MSSRTEYVKVHVDSCTLTLQGIGLNGAAFDGTTLSHCQQPVAPEIVVYARAASTIAGAWTIKADPLAAGGQLISNSDAGKPKVTTPAATPANYFEVTFNAVAKVPYRLWIRGKAQANSYNNDSVYVQFTNSIASTDAPQWRIGTTSATAVVIEDCNAVACPDGDGRTTATALASLVRWSISPLPAHSGFASRPAKTVSRSIRSCSRRRNISRRRQES